jgi:outer membrane protein
MSHVIESKGTRRIVAVLLGALGIVSQGAQAEDLVIPLELPQPNFIGLGVGAYPDYFGSSDYNVGAAPIGRLSLGGARFVRLMANEIRVNVLDHPDWQFGPVGLWRFGREDVDNAVVDRVHQIDDSISLGLFGGYVWRDPEEIRRMAGVSAWALGDVSGVYNGWTAGLNAYAMQPVAKMVTVGGGAAFTYGSGSYMDEYFGVTPADSLASAACRSTRRGAACATCAVGWRRCFT